MRIRKPYQAKPPFGTRLALGGAGGVPAPALFYALNEFGGTSCYSSVPGGPTLTTKGFGTANPWGAPNAGGLYLADAGAGACAMLPSSLQFPWPVTLAQGFKVLGTIGGGFGGVYYANTNTSPYIVLQHAPSGSGFVANWNSGDTSYIGSVFGTVTTGNSYVIATSVTPNGYQSYINGSLGASSTTAQANPSYSATSNVAIGNTYFASNNLNLLFFWQAIWPFALTAGQHALIGSSVNAIWRQFGSPLSAAALFPQSFSSFSPWLYCDPSVEVLG